MKIRARIRRSLSTLFMIPLLLMVAPVDGEAQRSGLPVWVDNPSEQFSKNRFLMAVGSSASREAAMNQAQANLAKIFVSRVDVDESYVQEFNETMDTEGEMSTTENTQLITQSQVGSNQEMKNVQIKEVYQSESGTFYALAAMDRMETAQLYTDEINRNNENIGSLRRKAEQTKSKLDRLIYMKQALNAAKVNDMLINQRAILSGQTSQGDGPLLSDITQEYRQAKKECTVSLIGEEIPQEVQSALSRQLQNEGFTVVGNGEKSVVEVNINLMLEPVDLNRPNHAFIQWALQVEAQNKESGQWFSTYMVEGREGSMNEQYARRRAIQAVRTKITSEFSEFINAELLSVR